MANLRRSNENALEKIENIFSKQNEGLSKEQREARLSELEKIASSVRARRSKSEGPRPTAVSRAKARIHA